MRHLLVFLFLPGFLLPWGVVYAADVEDKELSTMEVSAETISEPDQKELSIEQLQRNLATDMDDVFLGEPSISVGGGARNAQRIYLRGIESNNLNITIDGARQGRSLFQHHGDIGGIDPDLLKRVEVNPGPGADQGPGALGGSIRFETVDAQDLLEPGRRQGATVKTGFASVDDSVRGSTSVYGLLTENLGILGYIAGVNRKNYRSGSDNEVLNTAGQDRDYLLKLSLIDYAGHSLRIAAEHNSNTGDYNWGGSDAGYATDEESAVRQETERETYTFDHRYQNGGLLDWRLNLYSNDSSLENLDAESEVSSFEYGGGLSNTAEFALGMTRHSLTFGADYFEEEGTYEASGDEVDTGSDNFGLYLQERMGIGPLALTLGARFDDYSSDYGPETVSGDEISPSARAEIDLPKGWGLFAGYGEAVRGSSIIPIQWLANVADDVVINNGEAVKPEESRQHEAGVRFDRTDLLREGDAVSLVVTLYDIRLKNILEVEEGGSRGQPITAIYNNPDTLTSQGYEISAAWAWRAFNTRLSFSSFETEDSDGNPVGIVRRKTGSSGDSLTWDSSWAALEGVVLGYTLTAVARLEEVPEGNPERPGYALHSLQATWQPYQLPDLTVSLAVHNIFDKEYSRHTSIASDDGAIPEPGRDVRLGLTYRF